MKKHFGAIVMLVLIFFMVVAGILFVRSYNAVKKNKLITKIETAQSIHGEISVERYYKNGKYVKALGFYRNGMKKSEFYINDDEGLTTKYISYYPNGQVENKWERWVEAGDQHYLTEEFHPIGKLRKREGSKLLLWEYYDDDGHLTLTYELQGDKSIETMFHANGNKLEQSEYFKGVKQGRVMKWDSNGVVTAIEMYESGNRVQ